MLDHWDYKKEGPSSCLLGAIEHLRGLEDGCDYCVLEGVEDCVFHGTDDFLPSSYKDFLNNTDKIGNFTIYSERSDFAFGDDFSTVTNKRVLKVLGDNDFVFAMLDENK